MDLAQLRDISIVIFTVLGIIASLLFIIFSAIVFGKLMSILGSVQATVGNIRGTSDFVSEVIAKPVIRIASFAIGTRRACSVIIGLRKRKEERKSGARK
ncbi:MAG: hypothetical protein ABIH46_11390 [Chloroflexota bacterium]